MKDTRDIMGMPIIIEVVDKKVTPKNIENVFEYFESVDKRFSTYKRDSEISKINRNEILPKNFSLEMQEVFKLSEETKKITKGYFDIYRNGHIDPSGLVKGWAIFNGAKILDELGFENFYISAGGDIQVKGKNESSKKWRIGIKNPFNQEEIIKIVELTTEGIATSGTYIRGQHVYNPFKKGDITDIVSLSVIGPNIYEADRFATAAFAMGMDGIKFIQKQKKLEGYMIDKNGIATFTEGFEKYVVNN